MPQKNMDDWGDGWGSSYYDDDPDMTEADMCCPNCNSSILGGWVPAHPTSPVPDFVHRSNSPLSPEHRDLVVRAIDEVQADCFGLDSKINGLKRVIVALSAARRRRAQFMEDHEHLLSPARSVPRDIWSHVFQLATEDYYNSTGFESFGPKHPPMLMTDVCRSWRDCAILYTPTLWSKIQINLSHQQGQLEGAVLLLQAFLARSGSASLAVGLHSNWGRWEENEIQRKLKDEILAIMMLHSRRITEASFSFPIRYTKEEFAPFLSTCFCALQQLDLGLKITSDEGDEVPSALIDAPALRHLLIGSSSPLIMKPGSFPWAQLHSLDFILEDVRLFYDLLQWCPKLESLRLVLDIDGAMPDVNELQHVYHANLMRLRLAGLEQENVLFSKIETPALSLLELTDRFGVSDELGDGRHLIHFLQRAEGFLHLHVTHIHYFEFLEKLTAIQTSPRCIAALTICDGRNLDAVVSILENLSSESANEGLGFPSLTNLSLLFGIGLVDQDHVLLSRLQRALLNICRQVSPHSKPVKIPKLEIVTLEATLMEGSFEQYTVERLKEYNLGSLEVKMHVQKPKKEERGPGMHKGRREPWDL